MRIFIAFIILIIAVVKQSTFAQSMRIEIINQEDGLANDLTKSLIIDSLGFIWVATDDGIVYIHGRSFNLIDNPPKFSNNFKDMLFTKKFGFIATADPDIYGIQFFDDNIKASLLSETFKPLTKIKLHYPKTLYESNSDQSVWIADLRNVFQLTSDTVFTYSFNEKNHTDHFTRSYQFFEANGHFFVLSQHGYLYKLNKATNRFDEIPTDIGGTDVYTTINMSDQIVIIGHKKGFSTIEFDQSGNITNSVLYDYSPVLSLCKKDSMHYILGTIDKGASFLSFNDKQVKIDNILETKQETINDIVVDLSGNYWFATDHGIIVLREVMFGDPFNWLTRNYIQDLKTAPNGDLYFSDGKVYYLAQGSDKPEVFYQPATGMILKLCITPEGLWMTTNNGKIIFKPIRGKEKVFDFKSTGLAIYGIAVDKEGYIWFVQEQKSALLIRMAPDGSWVNMTPPDDSIRTVSCIKVSPQNDLYIGGQGFDHYLYKYDYVNKKLVNLSTPIVDEQYKTIRVTDIAFDSTNHIKLATTFGLWVWSSTQVLHLDLGEMTNDMVHSIVFDQKKQLWFTNANGILQIRGTEYILYNNNDGLPSKTCTFRTLIVRSDGEIWAGTISGLARGKIVNDLINTPRPVVVSADCSGEYLSSKGKITIATNDLLNFQFGTPVYPAKYLKYRYNLACDGDEFQILPSTTENLTLSNLKQGKYQLSVQVRNHGNYLWSNPLKMSFEVKKLWYTRIWVILVLGLLVAIAGFAMLSYLRWKNKKKTERLEQIIEERTRSLQEQNEELVALNVRLKEARDQAELAIKSKDRFFSILAHDLKSPFNTLIGFAQLLVFNRDELSNEDMQHLLDEMLSTSENTYKLLQNLLDWARSQTGAVKLKIQSFYLRDLIDDVLKVSEPSAKQKQIGIQVQLDRNIRLVTDVLFLTTVIRNLIANAIKFSFQNSIIEITANASDEGVILKIKDMGVGIPEEKIPVLFSIEHSYSTSGTANEKGTGLGLILCHEFISKIGGTLDVESKLGHGSTFIIYLPLEAPSLSN